MKAITKTMYHQILDLLRALGVLMPPFVVTALLAMVRLLTAASVSSGAWDVCCLLLCLTVWVSAAVSTMTRVMGKRLPKTGLLLSGILLVSVLFYALAYAMEVEAIGFSAPVWALGRLLGSPCAVSADGLQFLLNLFGEVTPGSAAMLTGAVYLCVGLAAGGGGIKNAECRMKN